MRGGGEQGENFLLVKISNYTVYMHVLIYLLFLLLVGILCHTLNVCTYLVMRFGIPVYGKMYLMLPCMIIIVMNV